MLEYWVEYQRWGWNALTLSFLATIFLSFFDGYGLWDQRRQIKQKKSVKSLGTIWFLNQMFVFAQFLVYGIYIKSFALAFHGLEFFLHLPIFLLVWKYHWKEKGTTRWEKFWLGTFVLTTVGIVLLPAWRDTLFSLMYISRLPAFLNKPWAIWKEKSPGVVSVKMVFIFFIGSLFWVVYAFKFETSFILKFMCTAIGAILLATLFLWTYFYYKEKRLKVKI